MKKRDEVKVSWTRPFPDACGASRRELARRRRVSFQLHCRAGWLNIFPAMEFAVLHGKTAWCSELMTPTNQSSFVGAQ